MMNSQTTWAFKDDTASWLAFTFAFIGNLVMAEMIKIKIKWGWTGSKSTENTDSSPNHPSLHWETENVEMQIIESRFKIHYETDMDTVEMQLHFSQYLDADPMKLEFALSPYSMYWTAGVRSVSRARGTVSGSHPISFRFPSSSSSSYQKRAESTNQIQWFQNGHWRWRRWRGYQCFSAIQCQQTVLQRLDTIPLHHIIEWESHCDQTPFYGDLEVVDDTGALINKFMYMMPFLHIYCARRSGVPKKAFFAIFCIFEAWSAPFSNHVWCWRICGQTTWNWIRIHFQSYWTLKGQVLFLFLCSETRYLSSPSNNRWSPI